MPPTRQEVAASVYRAIEAFNASDDARVPADEATRLLGSGGAVDSLGLVRLVLTVERQMQDDLGVTVSLTDEKAMSQRNSPFRSVASLIDYLSSTMAGSA